MATPAVKGKLMSMALPVPIIDMSMGHTDAEKEANREEIRTEETREWSFPQKAGDCVGPSVVVAMN